MRILLASLLLSTIQASYVATWMWDDHLFKDWARKNPARWSNHNDPDVVAQKLEAQSASNQKRPVLLRIRKTGTKQLLMQEEATDVAQAIDLLGKWRTEAAAAKEEARIQEEFKKEGYAVKWMWGDASIVGHKAARANPERWSKWSIPEDAIEQLEKAKRPVVFEFDDGYAPGPTTLQIAIGHLKQLTKTEDKVKWKFADASMLGPNSEFGKWLASMNPARWSEWQSVADTIADFEEEAQREEDLRIDIKIKQVVDGWVVLDEEFENRKAAIKELSNRDRWPAPPDHEKEEWTEEEFERKVQELDPLPYNEL